jgi:hypothetical protein
VEINKNIKENPFRVPENYFEELPSRIQHKMAGREAKPSRGVISLLHNPGFRIAASLILVAGMASVIFFVFNNKTDVETSLSIQEDYSIVKEYLLQDIDNAELFQAYLEMTPETENGYLFPSEDPEEQEVIDYLTEDGLIEYYLINDIQI